MATTPPVVTNVPVETSTVEERKAKALEDQAAAMARNAAAMERYATAVGSISGTGTTAAADRFERMLRACVEARVASTVEGFVTFARELCDACEREFPQQ